MTLAFCRERDELEKRMSALLRSLSENSSKAAKLARKPGPETSQEFASLHNADTLLRERLETLKSCLELHRDCHGC
jgi:hypothetical protein